MNRAGSPGTARAARNPATHRNARSTPLAPSASPPPTATTFASGAPPTSRMAACAACAAASASNAPCPETSTAPFPAPSAASSRHVSRCARLRVGAAVALLERHQRHAEQVVPFLAAVHSRRGSEEALRGGDVARGERPRRQLRRERREEPRVFRGRTVGRKRERAFVVLARLRQQTHARRRQRRERLLGVGQEVTQKHGVGHERARRSVHERPLPRPRPQFDRGRRRRRLRRVHRCLERPPPRSAAFAAAWK